MKWTALSLVAAFATAAFVFLLGDALALGRWATALSLAAAGAVLLMASAMAAPRRKRSQSSERNASATERRATAG